MANDTITNKLWSACNKMRQDPGTTGSLQYIEQFSWLLFLKVYEEIENEHEAKAAFESKEYKRNIDKKFRWSVWAGKENNDGRISLVALLVVLSQTSPY